MSDDLRERLHTVVEKLPPTRVADVLQFAEMLVDVDDAANIELEDAWLLASGAFRLIVQENEQPPIVIKT